MSALPHLAHRLRRWWHITTLRARAMQLDQAIDHLEAALDAEAQVLMDLRHERNRVGQRLWLAHHPRPPRPAQPHHPLAPRPPRPIHFDGPQP